MERNYESLNFRCPVCGAEPTEKCESNIGTIRGEFHIERKWIAEGFRPRHTIVFPPFEFRKRPEKNP